MKFNTFLSLIVLATLTANAAGSSLTDSTDYGWRKHSVYYEIFGNGLWSGSLNYDHKFNLGPKSGLILRGGIAWYEETFPLVAINFLHGNQKSQFEYGGGYTFFHEGGVAFLRMGYRYQGRKGLVFRAAPLYSINRGFVWFGISIGYSF